MPRLLAVLAVAALALAACGDDDAPDTTTTTTTAATTTSVTTPTTAATTSTTSLEGEGLGAIEVVAAQLLIGPGELNDPSFHDIGYAPDLLPCSLEVAPDVTAGTALRSDDHQMTVVEELQVYADTATATEVFESARRLFVCLGAPTDTTARVGADAFTIIGSDERITVAHIADTLLFVRIAPAVPMSGPNPDEIDAYAVGKVLAALGAVTPPG